jgi:hypothetical protein
VGLKWSEGYAPEHQRKDVAGLGPLECDGTLRNLAEPAFDLPRIRQHVGALCSQGCDAEWIGASPWIITYPTQET